LDQQAVVIQVAKQPVSANGRPGNNAELRLKGEPCKGRTMMNSSSLQGSVRRFGRIMGGCLIALALVSQSDDCGAKANTSFGSFSSKPASGGGTRSAPAAAQPQSQAKRTNTQFGAFGSARGDDGARSLAPTDSSKAMNAMASASAKAQAASTLKQSRQGKENGAAGAEPTFAQKYPDEVRPTYGGVPTTGYAGQSAAPVPQAVIVHHDGGGPGTTLLTGMMIERALASGHRHDRDQVVPTAPSIPVIAPTQASQVGHADDDQVPGVIDSAVGTQVDPLGSPRASVTQGRPSSSGHWFMYLLTGTGIAVAGWLAWSYFNKASTKPSRNYSFK
jgi:hypothetical protein